MYERQLRYDKIIACYLRDPLRKVSNSLLLAFLLQGRAACPAVHSDWAQLPCSSSSYLKNALYSSSFLVVVQADCVCLVERS